ncbi:6-phospho-3-hexuloisomerase [Bifidobacterium longum]|uniref:6-phospho-3-hexuloisomerase n=1 Tax=Bifidobacterium longum TaxID=216816 RepID=UPI000E20F788|nr:6-phospho-3-hexuloisomerase [Bifidobacterium longum]MDN4192090.1 6-phospho-3-hexuloisomerase [Bifidobacterium longum subsp. longum]RDX03114.1 6-phospho-3-hexuloisomerase [Bifidobacterium longum]RDX14348.1 6-phospho-3-hexuloisomerase [Bifidobacterium longum]
MTNETTAPSGTESRILDQIVAEITGVIAKMDEGDIERAMPLIGKTGRVYATGEGRSGFQARSFAMRMMHIGYTSYMMGETICPSMHEGDVLLAISGSGTTRRTVEDAEAAKKLGVKVIAVTSKPESPLAAAADAVIVVPGRVKGEAGGSIQLLSSLFDQSVHIALDALCLMLSRRDNVSDANANANHANVE